MKKTSITEAKNQLSALIAGLKGGSPVLIVDRGRPVARLEPVTSGPASSDARLSGLIRDGIVAAFSRLGQLKAAWYEIDPSDAVRETAARFLRVHPLRAADALQLASAFAAAEGRPVSLELISLDDRLCMAARKEGFAVIEI